MTLRTGTHASLAEDTMTAYIEAAMREEWHAARGELLPSDGPGAEDRRILFAAVAKGVLRYLHQHQDELVTTRMLPEGVGGEHRHHADFTLQDS